MRRQSKTVDVTLPFGEDAARKWLRAHVIPFTHMRARLGGGVAFRIRRGYLSDFRHQYAKGVFPVQFRENPPLVTFSNPPRARVLSHDVVEIRYRHAEDGKYYRHRFRRGQVALIANGTSTRCVLRRKDGRAIIRNY